jgi:toxin ParE1/3/4
MGIIHRTTASLRDYQVIWDYVALDNVPAADELLRTFDAKLELLSEYPKAGPARPELRRGIRSFPVGDYLLFYRPIHGGIELLRVLHGARNLRKALRDR